MTLPVGRKGGVILLKNAQLSNPAMASGRLRRFRSRRTAIRNYVIVINALIYVCEHLL